MVSRVANQVKQVAEGCPIPLRPKILLSGNIPKPMHGTAPRIVLGQQWWDKERKAAYALTNGHCLACGVHKRYARFRQWLEGHELYSINYSRGTMRYLETVALCHCCHNFIHDGRLQSLLDAGKITHAKFVAIIQHGDRVLADIGLKRKPHGERLPAKVAKWSRWRLIIAGNEYRGKYKTEKDWERAHVVD